MLPDRYIVVSIGISIRNCITFQNISNKKIKMIHNIYNILLIPNTEEGLGLSVVGGFPTGISRVASNIKFSMRWGKMLWNI